MTDRHIVSCCAGTLKEIASFINDYELRRGPLLDVEIIRFEDQFFAKCIANVYMLERAPSEQEEDV